MTHTQLSALDREVIVLQAVLESIQSMVNHEILNFSQSPEGMQATFKSPTRRALFNVLLADLLEPVDRGLIGAGGSLLDNLASIAAAPALSAADAATKLEDSVEALRRWLAAEIEVGVWFPSLRKDVVLRLRRQEFVSICGNISKHNVSRLTGKAKTLALLLKRNGVEVSFLDSLQALDDFQTRFQEDIFTYHSSTMAGLLNDVRWGMHIYLRPEFQRAFIPPVSEADPRYSFDEPEALTTGFTRDRYWDLMNSVRSEPWIEPFAPLPSLVGLY